MTMRLHATLLAIALAIPGLIAQSPPRPDLGKQLHEQPLERTLGTATPPPSRAPVPTSGLIHWHPDVAAALAASAQSGRPILRFQLLGRLDERFT